MKLSGRHIPNIITACRFVLIIIFTSVFLKNGKGLVPAIILLVIGFSDILDGFIARRWGLVTRLGAALDPLVDKCLVVAIMLCFFITKTVDPLILIMFAGKDLIMIAGGFVAGKFMDIVIPANMFGKISAVIFFIIVFFTILLEDIPGGKTTVNVMFTLSFLSSFFASLRYTFIFMKKKKEIKN